jgi:hypothetical protein
MVAISVAFILKVNGDGSPRKRSKVWTTAVDGATVMKTDLTEIQVHGNFLDGVPVGHHLILEGAKVIFEEVESAVVFRRPKVAAVHHGDGSCFLIAVVKGNPSGDHVL